MNETLNESIDKEDSLNPIFQENAFSRMDEGDDAEFYSMDRFVSHIDALALQTVEKLIGELIIEENPHILDLMAGWDSHIPSQVKPSRVVGLGLNRDELKNNKALSEVIVHDINKNPQLPLPAETFDAVINTVSVDYMTKPIQVFREVGRILKPGGLFLVIFSNRLFPQKAVKIWQESSEDERVLLVEDFFRKTGMFEKTSVFLSKGKPRPKDDKYAGFGIPSDPIYAVYGEREGGRADRRKRPTVTMDYGPYLSKAELEKRKKDIKHTMKCPYCEEKLRKWAVPDNPFTCTWDNDFMYICFNDECPYYVRGWDYMYREGNRGTSYRLMYNPERDYCGPIPVPSPKALKEGIID